MIVARNAVSTIGKAIDSALREPIDELLLLDDDSSDATLEVARSFEDSRLRIVSNDSHSTLGYARGFGLSKLKSDFCFLLDSDDMFLPGRIARLGALLENESLDFVADELELVHGQTGDFMRVLTIPGFLDKPPGLFRLFERNYLPGVGQIGFRVNYMARIGYDSNCHGVEDTDLVLRSLLNGARYELVREVGYRMVHYPNSVSRNRVRQNTELAKVLQKYDTEEIGQLWQSSGAPKILFLWSMVSFEIFRRNWEAAARWLADVEKISIDSSLVLEPDGPCPWPEGWRLKFFKGVLSLSGATELKSGAQFFREANDVQQTPESLNNLGVAASKLGRKCEAMDCFQQALQLKSDYSDALENLRTEGYSNRITFHPLRLEASRSEYSE